MEMKDIAIVAAICAGAAYVGNRRGEGIECGARYGKSLAAKFAKGHPRRSRRKSKSFRHGEHRGIGPDCLMRQRFQNFVENIWLAGDPLQVRVLFAFVEWDGIGLEDLGVFD